MNLFVTIERFVDVSFPGWVECSLVDADGQRHMFREKVPVVSRENLCEGDDYPRRGLIRCTLDAVSPGGPDATVVVDTLVIDGVESTTGLSRFKVKRSQVAVDDDTR